MQGYCGNAPMRRVAHLWSHGRLEVPLRDGDTFGIFRSVDPRTVEQAFINFAKNRGWEVI